MTEKETQAEIDDVDLALRMMDRDEDALAALLKVYGPKVKGYLRKQFGATLDDSELDYVFQQSVINVWNKIQLYDPDKGSLRGWFIRVSRNAAISHIRGEEKHKADPLADPADDHVDGCGDIAFPAESKEQKRLDRIDDFIQNKLQGIEKIVALNCFTIGGDPDIVRLAAKLGKTRSYVDTVKSKVKKKIREAILAIEASQSGRRDKK